jgi:hypothetical protein
MKLGRSEVLSYALLPSLITLEKPRVIFLYIALQTHPHHPGLVPFLEDFRMVHTQPVPEGYLGLDAAWHVRTTAFITSHVIHLLLSIQLSRELLSSQYLRSSLKGSQE